MCPHVEMCVVHNYGRCRTAFEGRASHSVCGAGSFSSCCFSATREMKWRARGVRLRESATPFGRRATQPLRRTALPAPPPARLVCLSFRVSYYLFPTGADNSRRVPRQKVHEAVRQPARPHPFHPIRSESRISRLSFVCTRTYIRLAFVVVCFYMCAVSKCDTY